MKELVWKKYFNLANISLSHGMSDGFGYLLLPVLPSIIKESNLSLVQGGLLVSVFSFASFFLLFPMSLYSDHIGKKKAILVSGLTLSGFSFLALGFLEQEFLIMLALIFLAGIGNSTFHPTATALVAEQFKNRKGLFLGIYSLGGNAGSAFMPLIIGVLALHIGWRMAIQLMVSPIFILAPLVFFLFPEILGTRRSLLASLRELKNRVFCNREILKLAGIYSLRGLGYKGVITFVPLLAANYMGLDSAAIGVLLAVYFAVGALSKPILGLLYDHFGAKRILFTLFFLGGFLTLAIAFSFSSSELFILIGLLAIASFVSPIILAETASLTDQKVRTSSIGFIYTAHGLHFLAPLIGGLIAQYTKLQSSFVFFAGMIFLGGIASLALRSEEKTPASRN